MKRSFKRYFAGHKIIQNTTYTYEHIVVLRINYRNSIMSGFYIQYTSDNITPS